MTLADIQCFCGETFGLPNSKRKQILVDFDKFCGAECLRDFIKSLPEDKVDPYEHCDIEECFLSEPLDYWCEELSRYFRSSYEASFALFCEAIKEPWQFENCVVFLSGRKQYNPDFYLPRINYFVEVKGRWAGSNKSKMRSCVNRGHKLMLIPDYLIRSINGYLSRMRSGELQ